MFATVLIIGMIIGAIGIVFIQVFFRYADSPGSMGKSIRQPSVKDMKKTNCFICRKE